MGRKVKMPFELTILLYQIWKRLNKQFKSDQELDEEIINVPVVGNPEPEQDLEPGEIGTKPIEIITEVTNGTTIIAIDPGEHDTEEIKQRREEISKFATQEKTEEKVPSRGVIRTVF